MNEEKLNKGVYEGEYNMFALPIFLKDYTFESIWLSVTSVFKKPTIESKAFERYIAYANNIDLFSDAKTASNVFDLQRAIFNSDGLKRPFNEFVEIAKSINKNYNTTWLKVEQDTAVNVYNSAKRWEAIKDTKKEYPYLRYQTVEDGNVRPLHAAWNGIVKHVNDPWWNTHMPPNDWNCRCRVVRVKRGKNTDLKQHLKEFNNSNETDLTSLNNDSNIFDVNFGKVNYIFGNKHPYFKLARKLKINSNRFVRF